MTDTPKPRCEDIGFQHMWDKLEAAGGWAMDQHGQVHPTQTKRQCLNCGRVEKWTCIQQPVPGCWDWRKEVPPNA